MNNTKTPRYIKTRRILRNGGTKPKKKQLGTNSTVTARDGRYDRFQRMLLSSSFSSGLSTKSSSALLLFSSLI